MPSSAKDYERAAEALRSLRQFLWENGNVGVMGRDHMARASRLLTEAAERLAWRPMADAPRDGTPVLLQFDRDVGDFSGIACVGRHRGDQWGWSFAAPVGMGGFADEMFVGWLPLPPAPGEPSAEEGP